MKFILRGDPPVKKNSQEIVTFTRRDGTTRRALIQNEKYRIFERDAGWQIPPSARVGIDYPVNIKAIYYRATLRTVDRPNLEEALLDTLVKWGVLADDNRDIAAASDGSRVMYDHDDPRIEVEITPLNDPHYELFRELAKKRSKAKRKRQNPEDICR